MKSYLSLLEKILKEGDEREDRTGTGTKALFGHQLRFDLAKGFPLLTTKKVHFKSVIYELLWFLRGDTNTKFLTDNKIKIWNEWADDNGDLGRVYGAQWRTWQKPGGGTVDQIAEVVQSLKNNPNSRRHLVVAFNPGELDQMALPPCHAFFQFFISNGKLSCQLYQRSADIFLGVPFNIASYAALTMMMAQVCDLALGEFVHTFGDVHLYLNHIDQARIQLEREVKTLPKLLLNKGVKSIFDFKYEDFELVEYDPHPRIQAAVAI